VANQRAAKTRERRKSCADPLALKTGVLDKGGKQRYALAIPSFFTKLLNIYY